MDEEEEEEEEEEDSCEEDEPEPEGLDLGSKSVTSMDAGSEGIDETQQTVAGENVFGNQNDEFGVKHARAIGAAGSATRAGSVAAASGSLSGNPATPAAAPGTRATGPASGPATPVAASSSPATAVPNSEFMDLTQEVVKAEPETLNEKEIGATGVDDSGNAGLRDEAGWGTGWGRDKDEEAWDSSQNWKTWNYDMDDSAARTTSWWHDDCGWWEGYAEEWGWGAHDNRSRSSSSRRAEDGLVTPPTMARVTSYDAGMSTSVDDDELAALKARLAMLESDESRHWV